MNSRDLQVDSLRCWGLTDFPNTPSAIALLLCLFVFVVRGPNYVVKPPEMSFRK